MTKYLISVSPEDIVQGGDETYLQANNKLIPLETVPDTKTINKKTKKIVKKMKQKHKNKSNLPKIKVNYRSLRDIW